MPMHLDTGDTNSNNANRELITKMFIRMSNAAVAVSWMRQEGYELAREHARHTIMSFGLYHEVTPIDENFIAELLGKTLPMYYDENNTRRHVPMEGAVRFTE